jgi:hypothetical protein
VDGVGPLTVQVCFVVKDILKGVFVQGVERYFDEDDLAEASFYTAVVKPFWMLDLGDLKGLNRLGTREADDGMSGCSM